MTRRRCSSSKIWQYSMAELWRIGLILSFDWIPQHFHSLAFVPRVSLITSTWYSFRSYKYSHAGYFLLFVFKTYVAPISPRIFANRDAGLMSCMLYCQRHPSLRTLTSRGSFFWPRRQKNVIHLTDCIVGHSFFLSSGQSQPPLR